MSGTFKSRGFATPRRVTTVARIVRSAVSCGCYWVDREMFFRPKLAPFPAAAEGATVLELVSHAGRRSVCVTNNVRVVAAKSL